MAARTKRDPLGPYCPAFTKAIEIIGRRWTGAVLRSMMSGDTRFSEILATVPGLSDRLLSERLKELEAEGIVQRTVTPETPVRIDYELTEKGRALASALRTISKWADEWGDRVPERSSR